MRRGWKQSVWNGAAGILLAGTTTVGAATFPYSNDFSAAGLPNVSDAHWTHNAAGGTFDFSIAPAAGNEVSTSDVEVTGMGSNDFIVSSRFTLVSNDHTGVGTSSSIGFGAFGSTSGFGTNYLADWFAVNPASSSAGGLRIIAQGDTGGHTNTRGDSDGAVNGDSIVVGNTYELRLTGLYTGAPGSETLNMTLALFDDSGVQLGTPAIASDTSPLTGTFFGYRNRVVDTTTVEVDFDNFSVGVVPEPTFMATFAAAGSVVLLRRGRRTEPRALAQE